MIHITSRDSFKYHTLWSDDDAPPRHRRHRQRDVIPKGQPLADIARTLGHAEWSRATGESFEEWALRQLHETKGA